MINRISHHYHQDRHKHPIPIAFQVVRHHQLRHRLRLLNQKKGDRRLL